MNEPQWTTTIPVENGFYWYRSSRTSRAHTVELYVAKGGEFSGKMVVEMVGANGCLPTDEARGEFWPVPIPAPPT